MLDELFFSTESPELTKILDTAEQLFRKYGIRSVAMSDIAQGLGMSKKTIYVHIANKDELVDKVIRRHFCQEFYSVQDIMTEAKDALDVLRKISLHVQREMQNISPALIFDLQKYHSESWALVMKFHSDVVAKQIRANLEQGMIEGLYRKDLNVDLISRIYANSLPIFTDNDFFEQHSRAEIHQQFIKYHILGIVSEKGRERLKSYQIWNE